MAAAAPPPPLLVQSAPPEPQAAPWQQAPPAYAPPPPPQYATQQYPPQYAPQQYAPQPPHQQGPPATWPPHPARSGPPTWLMTVGVAVGLLVVGGGIYFAMQRFGSSNPAEKAGLENPSNASRQKVSNPLQKYVEVVGLRLISENKKPVAKFVVVNHSSTEIDDLSANVTLWASTSRSEEDSVGSFTFKVPVLLPNDSKDLTEALKTKLKIYELPDWQNTTAEIQITSPAP
jgi:hypothetical protein